MARDARERRRGLLSVPSRFMQPRVVLYVTTFALVALGLLMIYSSSSITAMSSEVSEYNAAFYLQRQALFGTVGLVAAALVAFNDYHLWSRTLLPLIWVITVGMLILVLTSAAGQDAYGATRWIRIGSFSLQPSEFAKLTVIMTAANIASRYFEDDNITFGRFIQLLIIGVLVPLIMIVMQPDKGTTIICATTLLVMGYLAGVPRQYVMWAVGMVIVAVIFLMFKDEYSRARVFTAFDPWRDPYGDGYQLIQGFYAFGSGGLFGVGVGMSRQKYSYLPMAHNDFIFAVIGEELGLAGTVGMLATFALFVWAGFQIARYAPDLSGRLIAAGCTTLIVIQLLVNICGVLGLIPLTGKPVPFVSYGGSSIISCLMLVGLIASVSRHSSLPETVFEERRRGWSVSSQDDAVGEDEAFSLVGEATPRSARATTDRASSSFTVLSGGTRSVGSHGSDLGSVGGTTPDDLRAARAFSQTHAGGRVTTDANGRRRIDLGPSGSERLRSARDGSTRKR